MKEEIKNLGLKIPMSYWHYLRKVAYENETSVNGAAQLLIKKAMEEENAND